MSEQNETNPDNKAAVRALKQVDRDLMTVRELLRAGIQSGGEAIATADISTRIKAALTTFETIAAKAGA